MPVSIRIARTSDAETIADLTSQLGYDLSSSTTAERLSRFISRSDHLFLVAELDQEVVGWIHVVLFDYIESGPFAVIGGLVVDRHQRRHGIGRLLMKHAEEWARQQGSEVVRLWSSASRTVAHRFYERLGYTNVKTQYSFVKPLDGANEDAVRAFIPRIEP
jgi:predicted N-acetyltransferase YhbS